MADIYELENQQLKKKNLERLIKFDVDIVEYEENVIIPPIIPTKASTQKPKQSVKGRKSKK